MIGEALLDALHGEQYAVDWVRDGLSAESALLSHTYDLVVLASSTSSKRMAEWLNE